ncbi:MAG: hypothetical protein ACE5IL_13930, partial [Myxococcota bacterium]
MARILEGGAREDHQVGELARLELGTNASALLERFADARGRRASGRTRARFQAGAVVLQPIGAI